MLETLLLIIHVLVGVLICIVILMQSAKGEGLSGAFGMGQGTTSFFGADTANVLVKITTVLAVIFMLTSLSLAYIRSQAAASVASKKASAAAEAGATEEGVPEEGATEGATGGGAPTEGTEAETPGAATEGETPSTEAPTTTPPATEEPAPTTPPADTGPTEPGADEPVQPPNTDS
jgi:preprotein translocase subunit SecG